MDVRYLKPSLDPVYTPNACSRKRKKAPRLNWNSREEVTGEGLDKAIDGSAK